MKIEKVQDFIEKIAESTTAGQVEWQQHADGYFKTRLGGGWVSIHEVESQNPWEEPDYVLGFRNQKDEFLTSFSDSDFRGIWSDAFKVFRNLYRTVRLEAIGFEEFLDDMNKDLDSKDL